LIATTTGGAYVRGIGPSLGLDKVFDDHIATMERREISSTLERRHEQRFQIPLGIALALLLLELLVSRGRVRGSRLVAPALFLSIGLVAIGNVAHAADPMQAAREGFTAYDEGRYEDAVNAYREALLDEPESPLFRFNLAATLYQQERFEESAAEFANVAGSEDESWGPIAAYNQGNSLFRMGEATESSDPAATLQQYAQSLAAFRRAMSLDPKDTDPKHGYEFVSKKLEELEQKQEEEQPEEQQSDNQGDDSDSSEDQQPDSKDSESQQDDSDPQPDQSEQSEDSSDQEHPDDPQDSQSREQPQASDAPTQDGSDTEPARAEEPSEEEQQAAQAILDAARAEELEPEDVDRGIRVQGGPPIKDW
jgi:Ca-activated chloride channel family protein